MSTQPDQVHPHVPELLARVQACLDQVAGFLLVLQQAGPEAFPVEANAHVARVTRILQEQLDGLYHHLGATTAAHYVEASRWLLTELREHR